LDDHASPEFIKEKVIVPYIKKHPVSLVDAILAYAGETSSNVKFLLAKNEQLAKNLQASRKEVEQL